MTVSLVKHHVHTADCGCPSPAVMADQSRPQSLGELIEELKGKFNRTQ